MLERQVPDGERLELRVAGRDAPLPIVVHLAQARRQLAGARAGGRHDDEVPRGLGPLIGAEALLRDDRGHGVRVAGDHAVAGHLQAEALELLEERQRTVVGVLQLRDHHVLHQEPALPEHVHEAQDVVLVRDAQVGADLVPLEVLGVEAHQDLGLVLDAVEHRDLVVRGEAGQDAGGVQVVEELAAHLQVQLPADLAAAFLDVLGLELDVLRAVESDAVEGAGGRGLRGRAGGAGGLMRAGHGLSA